VRKTYTTSYDEAGRVATAGDGVDDRVGDQDRLTNHPPRRRHAENTTRLPGFSASPRLGGYFPRIAPHHNPGNLFRKTVDTNADGTIEESGLSIQPLQGWRGGWVAGNPG
jgi:hypothetical protein